MQPRAWMEIDIKQLQENYQNLCAYTNMRCICVVKTDGYGHGAVKEAQVLQQCGATMFAVACASEAKELRENGIVQDILILGHTMPDEIPWLWEYNIIQTIGDVGYGRYLAHMAKENHQQVRAHFKIDTGMHRLGIDHSTPMEELAELYHHPNLKVEGAFSHFAVADSTNPKDVAFTHQQRVLFDCWLISASKSGMSFEMTHLAASAGIVNYPQFQYDACRPGILLLGFDSGEMKYPYPRKPVMSLKSLVGKLDWLEETETIGYGRTYTATKRIKVATIPIGYGDGIPRNYQQGQVLIGGVRCPIIGRISMDQLCVDASACANVELFDEAVLIGTQGNDTITLEEMAQKAGTISNEIATKINKRIVRIYRK